ncbi:MULTISPECIES: SCO1664 family protein [Kocuria]|uniref:SCO1664 family protein n=1 Tax=Kocuria subflava TaxID=1736139 RepID=A0A846TZQ0_9MICC|nr:MULTISPECIES: SCO1664 family protein [Kocuria]NKE10687.1 SCO1664 family protein [Kocuria subflava]
MYDDEALLATGDIELVGLIESSSNSALLVQVLGEAEQSMAVYKPEEGERPLRDFPPRIYRRERAAYVLSEGLGWNLVPPTVLRDDAPFGPGSVQKFIPHDPRQHYFTLYDNHPETHEQLMRTAVFDVVANNTDRKGGHVLLGADGHVWGIDQGLCFSAPFKLRTVIWEFAGLPLPEDLVADLQRLEDDLPAELEELLFPVEQYAIQLRVRELLDAGVLPFDETGGYRIPWPPL